MVGGEETEIQRERDRQTDRMRHGREGKEREMVGGNETGRQRDRETESERW